MVLHPSDELYGADRVLLEVLDAISSVVEPIVVLPRDVPIGLLSIELEQRGVRIERATLPVIRRRDLSPVGIVRLSLRTLIGFVNVLRLARMHGARAIHTNTSILLGGSVAARVLGIAHVWHIHELLDHERALGTVVAVLSRIGRNRVVVVSEAVRSAIETRHGLVSLVLRNPAPDLARQPAATGPETVLMIGRVNGGKGHDIFVQAASSLHVKYPRVLFTMVGGSVPGREGPYESLVRLVDVADPSGRWLTFRGWSSNVAEEIQASTVVVLPSTMPESLNITALEAMAVGRPVVASAIGGLPEVINDGVTGLLVPPGDPTALAFAIESLLRSPELTSRLVDAACDQLGERFSRARYAEAWRLLYGHLTLAEPQGRGSAPVTGNGDIGSTAIDPRATSKR